MDEGRAVLLPAAKCRSGGLQVEPARAARATSAQPGFATIATPDRAAQSRIFARSARECHPEARLIVLALECDEPQRIFADCYDLVLSLEQLSLDGLADMRFRYSTAELCAALKPWLIRRLLEKSPDDPVYYFDSDVELISPLDEAEAALAQGANLVLTPHILQPGADQDRERSLLRSGSFNAGFLAVAPSEPAREFLAWWCERVRTGCGGDHPESSHGDQQWLELAPSICDGVVVLRHPGYNFAYWNAHERPLTCLGGSWSAAGWPLRFVHYSQWNLHDQEWQHYLTRYFGGEQSPFAELSSDYQKKVRKEGPFGERQSQAYSPLLTPSGRPIPDFIRRAYERRGTPVDGDGSDVFGHAVAVLTATSETRAALPDLPVSVLYDEIWQRHADLKYRFDIDRTDGRLAYLQWLVDTGIAELGIPAAFVPPAPAALERERVRQLEAAHDGAASPLAVADPAPPVLPPSAEPETVAGLLAARDAARGQSRRQENDIRLLVSSNKALRREVQGLRVQRWCEEERLQALDAQLAQLTRARDAIGQRNRQLTDQLARLRSGSRSARTAWRGAGKQLDRTLYDRRPITLGEGPFFRCGFQLGDSCVADGTTVKRIKAAPSGTFIFGPYLDLAPGTYAVTLDARLYRRLPLITDFKLDIVCDQGRQTLAWQMFRLHALARWQRFELMFSVYQGEDYADFEMRVWGRRGTPIEVGRIDIFELCAKADAAPQG